MKKVVTISQVDATKVGTALHVAALQPIQGTTMKSFVIASVLATTAFAASAMSGNGEIYGFDQTPAGPSKTRAEVVAELREAQAAGTIAFGDADIKRIDARQKAPTSQLTRAEVRMEVAELAAEGKLFLNNHSNGGIHRN